MASGIAWLSLNTDTSLSEYTTKSPSTAAGSTFPRYFICFGVSLFAGKAIKGKNLVIVAHRLNTIKQAHQIILIDKGQIISKGKHDELMKNPLYLSLWNKYLGEE